MKKTSIIGFPRIGAKRELKKWTEGYFAGTVRKEELLRNAADLRRKHWTVLKTAGIDFIPSNDFSFYDTFLDTAFLLNVIPARYRKLNLDAIDTYFAMAKGYQGKEGDVHALPMKKWFNTNYHYIISEIDDDTEFRLNGTKPFDEYLEAKNAGIQTKPVLVGPFTFLKLSEVKSSASKTMDDFAKELIGVYSQILHRFDELRAGLIQLDEPALVMDMSKADVALFRTIYSKLLASKGHLQILLQTYFGDVREVYEQLITLDFDGIGLDFVEGPGNLSLVERYGFPGGKTLFAGLVNGKNIWKNRYKDTLTVIDALQSKTNAPIVVGASCSLLHVPYTVANEPLLEEKSTAHFAFALEKLAELRDLAILSEEPDVAEAAAYQENERIFEQRARETESASSRIRQKVEALREEDFARLPSFEDRRALQNAALRLPLLPTTTIGSFPQTAEVRRLRSDWKSGRMDSDAYWEAIRSKIRDVVRLQEQIGLDVLVHGEFERNDMVEYFGEKLDGFVFTKNAWVQSYGTRCVKPPIIFGDVKRSVPMTVDVITYAQSLTEKPMKGMLTGPVTILNWSFPREDLSRREIALQIALAIREEVEDLEANGIRVIQIDEAALREKLPLRRSEWHSKYLDWAIPAFRLVHAGVKPETQIHTHMCYSEFADIIREIDDMDADVITFEAAKSDLSLIDVLRSNKFRTEVGPGVYDIHSPRVPAEEELREIIIRLLKRLDVEKLWINPDCGLKTRGERETIQSLTNMVNAAKSVRVQIEDLASALI